MSSKPQRSSSPKNPRTAEVPLELLRRTYRLLAGICFDIDGVSWNSRQMERLALEIRDAIEEQEDRELHADLARARAEREQSPAPIASLSERLRATAPVACACDGDRPAVVGVL